MQRTQVRGKVWLEARGAVRPALGQHRVREVGCVGKGTWANIVRFENARRSVNDHVGCRRYKNAELRSKQFSFVRKRR